jgi:hypothetical protein
MSACAVPANSKDAVAIAIEVLTIFNMVKSSVDILRVYV